MFSKILIASGLAALAAAQSAVLTFTHVPNPVTDGQAAAITYSTNDTTSPVTIILRKGQSNDLQTVSTLTKDATGGQFVWMPDTSLADGTDYALEITQGTQINYFGPFQVQGANPSAASSASASSMTGSASAYVSSTLTANGTASTTVPIAPGTVSAGNSTMMSRNTTMSMATLSATSTAGTPSSNTASATGSGAGFQGSSTASAASSSSTNAASGVEISSAFSLLFGAAAAAFYL